MRWPFRRLCAPCSARCGLGHEAAAADPVDDALARFARRQVRRHAKSDRGTCRTSGHPHRRRGALGSLRRPRCSFKPPTRSSTSAMPKGAPRRADGETERTPPAAQAGPRQQPRAPRPRGGARLLDPPVTDPEKRRRAISRSSSPATPPQLPLVDAALAREADTDRAALEAARAAIVLLKADAPAADASPPSSTSRAAATRTRRRSCARCPGRHAGRLRRRCRVGRDDHRAEARALGLRAERRLRHQPRLGPAARRRRPRHHLRPDGRHQHGPWRDGDARRLHDLRGAGGDPHPRAGSVRRLAVHRDPAGLPGRGAVGIAIERGIIRFLYGRPLETLLATWGLSLILQQAVRSVFGPTNREVGTPRWMSGAFEIGG